MRKFIGIDLSIEGRAGGTTLLYFHQLLEKHAMTQRIFKEISARLSEQGLFLREGAIDETTIVTVAPTPDKQSSHRDRS